MNSNLFIYLFFFLANLRHMDFLGQGSDPSCSCELSLSCGNAGSLTHCDKMGIIPSSQHSQDTTNPNAPQRKLPNSFKKMFQLRLKIIYEYRTKSNCISIIQLLKMLVSCKTTIQLLKSRN